MILETMLQRLYQSLLKGPGLNARPHNSRQRVDVTSLAALTESFPANAITNLLEHGKFEVAAMVPRFKRPDYPEAEWSDDQKEQCRAWDQQGKLLRKLSGIATDAKEYFNDHGEDALFVGFPLVSLPPGDDRKGFGSSRVIAPLGMIPVNIAVRTNARPGVTVTTTEEGADRLIPNPALLAWIEQMTGESADALYGDEEGENPWLELQSILDFVAKGVGLEALILDPEATLKLVPRSEGLPDQPTLLNSAIMGLFPMRNPGMIRDTQWMIENEADLKGPVRSFLKREAIYGDGPEDLPAAEEVSVEDQANFQRNFAGEFMITRADPCQTAAVEEAARARALVIHGPPGTGKSQTIANIIGDHLARGERVLFVCDKRTTLDVVKYRLDADEGEIETEEDLHSHQMSEMEDLLSATLNLDVSEAFLDVHYRSRNEALIGFSNESFYGDRLQPIPGHPKNKAFSAPIRLTSVKGVYKEQSNPAEGLAVVEKVVELLDDKDPPSIGIATFNIKQRNLIIEMLDERAAEDSEFSEKLALARCRRGDDSFEGLFVKNLENVQGDERDVMIISTTFGRDEEGKFRRNFGALSRVGGERRLNVLVTRARSEILVMTSIPREEYQSGLGSAKDGKPNGRHFLYSYLCYAERLEILYERYHDELEEMKVSEVPECEVLEARQPSKVAAALGQPSGSPCAKTRKSAPRFIGGTMVSWWMSPSPTP